jgi:hypothetical protein
MRSHRVILLAATLLAAVTLGRRRRRRRPRPRSAGDGPLLIVPRVRLRILLRPGAYVRCRPSQAAPNATVAGLGRPAQSAYKLPSHRRLRQTIAIVDAFDDPTPSRPRVYRSTSAVGLYDGERASAR